MKSIALPLVTTATHLLMALSPAQANSATGLFITHDINKAAYQRWVDSVRPVLQAQDCKPFRQGELVGTQGPLDWNSVDYFAAYSCSAPVLETLVKNGHYKALTDMNDEAIIVEGDLKRLTNTLPPLTSEYVIKLSYHNELDNDARLKDLNQLGADAMKAGGAWTVDAMLTPTSAVGLLRPDDITFLYYPTKKQGDAFRKKNPAIMKQIETFNQDHLVSFTYLFGPLSK